MTWDEFIEALKRAKLSQRGFARTIKANSSTVNKWRLQEQVPGYAEVIVILLANDPKRVGEL
jgi:DNA-binding transcriptional regulator YiaG